MNEQDRAELTAITIAELQALTTTLMGLVIEMQARLHVLQCEIATLKRVLGEKNGPTS